LTERTGKGKVVCWCCVLVETLGSRKRAFGSWFGSLWLIFGVFLSWTITESQLQHGQAHERTDADAMQDNFSRPLLNGPLLLRTGYPSLYRCPGRPINTQNHPLSYKSRPAANLHEPAQPMPITRMPSHAQTWSRTSNGYRRPVFLRSRLMKRRNEGNGNMYRTNKSTNRKCLYDSGYAFPSHRKPTQRPAML
jgi:hypothetical protein